LIPSLILLLRAAQIFPDLSLWPSKGSSEKDTGDVSDAGNIAFGNAMLKLESFILDDYTQEVVELLQESAGKEGEKTVGIVVDNAGYELVSDLILGHFLLSTGAATKLIFFTKAHPTFISDATNKDCLGTINFLESVKTQDGRDTYTSKLASEMRNHLESGKFVFEEDLFWCQPQPFWDMPEALVEQISNFEMVFVKGDANYRYLLKTYHHLTTTSLLPPFFNFNHH
jgi:uncharacterized protein with ATP-grasp and redox domains